MPFLFALALGASLSSTALMPSALAQAQQQQQAQQDQADQEKEASPSDKAAFLNARIAGLKAVLDLTPDQEKLWGPFETALRDAHKDSEDRAQKMHSASEPNTVFELLDTVADHEIARAQALKKIVAAAQPLVASSKSDAFRLSSALESQTMVQSVVSFGSSRTKRTDPALPREGLL
jgi:hypothetical protein